MRTVAITIHNNQTLELYLEKRKEGFELWVVGPVKGLRMLIDHHLTHDSLEPRLEYAEAGDIVWRDAVRSEIPSRKHQNAVEMEATISQRTFWDFEVLHHSLTEHLGAIGFLAMDQKELSIAETRIIGQWTDGLVTLEIEPDRKLQWSCTDSQHPLNVGERVHGHAPNWWNFSFWRLALMNSEHKCGTHVDVLRVDDHELHLEGNHMHRIARVFRRMRK